MSILQPIIQTKFACTSRKSADALIRDELDLTLKVGELLGPGNGIKSAKVPAMMGIDEDMRSWSYYQILEHNKIVNKTIMTTVMHLLGQGDPVAPGFNSKTDVMPSAAAGITQVEAFRESVEAYLAAVSAFPKLRATQTRPHPLFGPFNAHKWHCMSGFHLSLHRKQAEKVAQLVLGH